MSEYKFKYRQIFLVMCCAYINFGLHDIRRRFRNVANIRLLFSMCRMFSITSVFVDEYMHRYHIIQ